MHIVHPILVKLRLRNYILIMDFHSKTSLRSSRRAQSCLVKSTRHGKKKNIRHMMILIYGQVKQWSYTIAERINSDVTTVTAVSIVAMYSNSNSLAIGRQRDWSTWLIIPNFTIHVIAHLFSRICGLVPFEHTRVSTLTAVSIIPQCSNSNSLAIGRQWYWFTWSITTSFTVKSWTWYSCRFYNNDTKELSRLL